MNAPVRPKIHLSQLNAVLALLLAPLVAALGAFLVNIYEASTIRYTALVLIALVPLIVHLFGNSYALTTFAVWISALSMLISNALIGVYLWGWDIHVEAFLANSVLREGYWDPSIADSNIGIMLSITILVPILCSQMGLDVLYVLKYCFPLLLSFLPVVIFLIASKHFSRDEAFWSSYVFLGLFVFSGELLQLGRQQLVELLIACLLLLGLRGRSSRDALVLFLLGFGVIFSHYGLTYLFLAILLLGLLVPRALARGSSRPFLSNPAVLLVLASMTFLWYGFQSALGPFESLVLISSQIREDFTSKFLDASATQGLGVVVLALSPVRQIARVIHLAVLGMILLGFMASFRKKLPVDTLRLGFGSSVIIGATVIVPSFASALNLTRVYQSCLLFAIPFFGAGSSWVFDRLSRMFVVKGGSSKAEKVKPLTPYWKGAAMAVFLAIFSLFNSGVVYHAMGEPPTGIHAGIERQDWVLFDANEVTAARWTGLVPNFIFADSYRAALLRGFQLPQVDEIGFATEAELAGGWLFLGEWNAATNTYLDSTSAAGSQYFSVHSIEVNRDALYDSGALLLGPQRMSE